MQILDRPFGRPGAVPCQCQQILLGMNYHRQEQGVSKCGLWTTSRLAEMFGKRVHKERLQHFSPLFSYLRDATVQSLFKHFIMCTPFPSKVREATPTYTFA